MFESDETMIFKIGFSIASNVKLVISESFTMVRNFYVCV